MERYEQDEYGFRVAVLTELESVEEQQYRLRRYDRQATRTPQQAAGDHYQEMLSVPGWAEAQPF